MPDIIHMYPNLYDALVIGIVRESIRTYYTMNKPNISVFKMYPLKCIL